MVKSILERSMLQCNLSINRTVNFARFGTMFYPSESSTCMNQIKFQSLWS